MCEQAASQQIAERHNHHGADDVQPQPCTHHLRVSNRVYRSMPEGVRNNARTAIIAIAESSTEIPEGGGSASVTTRMAKPIMRPRWARNPCGCDFKSSMRHARA